MKPLPIACSFLALSSCAAPAAPPATTQAAPPAATSATSTPKPITLGAGGKLQYAADARGSIVPDFSGAGYAGGGVAIPDVPVKVTLSPAEGDDTAIIAAAIEQVSALPPDANGFRGAILLKKGRYDISSTLHIKTSGIVIRGEGAGRAGTYLVHSGGIKQDSFQITGTPVVAPTVTTITSSFVPVGANKIQVASVNELKTGHWVEVRCNQTDKWVDTLKFTGIWKAADFSIKWKRRITAIDKARRELTLSGPITSQIDTAGGMANGEVGIITEDARVRNVGFEDFLILSTYDPSSKDAFGYANDEEHARRAINFQHCTDSWVRGVAGFFYSFAFVWVRGDSSRITIEDCAMLDGISADTPRTHKGARKYYFSLSGSETLAQRCYSRYGRHSYALNSPTSGNVFLDCYSEKGHLGQEPHQRWQHGSLFDNVFSDSTFKLNRSDHPMGHGQRAANCMLWNCVSQSTRTGEAEIQLDNPNAGLGQNWAIGCLIRGKGKGLATPGPETQVGEPSYVESLNQPVQPRSLYLQQLRERLGEAALARVAIPAQLKPDYKVENGWKEQFDSIPHFASPTDLSWMPERITFPGRG